MFNREQFNDNAAAFVNSGEKAQTQANAFSLPAYAGLLSEQLIMNGLKGDDKRDDIANALCVKAEYRSKPKGDDKGRAVPDKLPAAVKQAHKMINRNWQARTIPGVLTAINGFVGVMTDEQHKQMVDDYLAFCELKGKEPTERGEAAARNAALDVIYGANRAQTVGALDRLIGSIINKAKQAESEGEADAQEADAQDDEATLADTLARILATIKSLSAADVVANADALASITKAIDDATADAAELAPVTVNG